MKKNSFKRVASALAIAAVAASASSMAAFADEYNGYDMAEINGSEVKPTVFISVDGTQGGKVFDETIAGKTVECTLNVKDAANKYASTGFHVFFDKRLALAEDGGYIDVSAGGAISKISPGEPVKDETDASMNGFFAASAGSSNRGNDGVMWTFNLVVPADAKAGDVFPIDIIYKSSDNAEDLFVNTEVDKAGELMQAYVFTKGIYNPKENNTFAAAADDVAKCAALADISKSADAYIAIAGGTTTTETTTTTTETTTTTTVTETEATTTESTTASAAASGSSTTATGSSTTAKSSSTASGTGTTKNPKTGVSGTGAALAVAGLAAAVATAFALRKKED